MTYNRSKNKRNTIIYFNTNYRKGMKVVPIIVDYCLLQFDALNVFLGVCLLLGSLPNLVRSKDKLGANLSNNLTKYEVFSFQPIGALELRSMTSELKIQVPY